MSWTSEFELPPQGPQVLADEAEIAAESVEKEEPPQPEESIDTDDEPVAEAEAENRGEHLADEALDGPGFELSDEIPEDGPLDPSVFDGLFADLTEPAPAPEDYVQPREFESERDHEPHKIEADQIDQVEFESVDDEPAEDFDENEDIDDEDIENEDIAEADLENEDIENEDIDDEDPFDDGPSQNGDVKDQDPANPIHQLFEPVPAKPASDPVLAVQVLEQPVPAVATSPPIAFDEQQAETNGFEAAPYYEMPAAEVVDQLNPTVLAERPRRWPAFVTAILIGGTLGIGGAVALTTLQPSDDENQAAPAAAPITANEVNQQQTSADQQTGDQAEPSADDTSTGQQIATSLLVDGELALSSVRFVPGTTELSASSQEILQRLTEAIEGAAPEPTTITVRTFTEPTAQANLDLSVRQAAAINDYLASLGVQFGGLSLRGIGAAPLQDSLPVPNFVAVNPNLQATGLKEAMSDVGPFEIGIDPDSLQLRPESIKTLTTIGSALSTNSGSISLAGYSYDRPNGDANKAMASAAVDAAMRYLVENHQIDPARLSPLTPGSFPYVLGPADGGHVEIKRGRSAAVEVAIHSVDHSVLAFASGSDALSGAAAEELTRIASLISESDAVAVISVRSAGESSSGANSRLSQQQAEAIGSFLSDAGLGDERFRTYGIGDVAKLRTDAVLSEVTVTILS